jgi:hypothetical protein
MVPFAEVPVDFDEVYFTEKLIGAVLKLLRGDCIEAQTVEFTF